jgi:hypothetical protein
MCKKKVVGQQHSWIAIFLFKDENKERNMYALYLYCLTSSRIWRINVRVFPLKHEYPKIPVKFCVINTCTMPVPVAARSKA